MSIASDIDAAGAISPGGEDSAFFSEVFFEGVGAGFTVGVGAGLLSGILCPSCWANTEWLTSSRTHSQLRSENLSPHRLIYSPPCVAKRGRFAAGSIVAGENARVSDDSYLALLFLVLHLTHFTRVAFATAAIVFG